MKYSKAFQSVIDKCKNVKWVLVAGCIRRADDKETCPLSHAMGEVGLCGIEGSRKHNFRSPVANFYTFAAASDNLYRRRTLLENRVRRALLRELKVRK